MYRFGIQAQNVKKEGSYTDHTALMCYGGVLQTDVQNGAESAQKFKPDFTPQKFQISGCIGFILD